MKAIDWKKIILEHFADVYSINTYGELSFFYNPDNQLPKGIYLTTIKEKDGPNDKASKLNRKDVYRLNIGISQKKYEALFGKKPTRPQKGGIVNTGHDFSELNILTPHPIYAWLHWVSIVSPDENSQPIIIGLLEDSYQIAKIKFQKKL